MLKKNVVEGEPAITPIDFFEEKNPQIKEFLRNHRNTKIKMIMMRLMEKKRQDRSNKKKIIQDKVYFHSDTYINDLEKTDINSILFGMIYEILDAILFVHVNINIFIQ